MSDSPASVIVRANQTLIVDGDLDAAADFFAPDYLVHLTDRDLTGGHATVRKVVGMLRRAFPDVNVEVEVLVEDGDRVAWQRTLRGTHEGSYHGFPATGRSMVWRDMATTRFEGGVIVEEWMLSDLAERLLLARK